MSGPNRRPRILVPPIPLADITLVFDGGALGNPGKGYGSFIVRGALHTPKPVRLEYPGRTTNNQAEYLTLVHGLRTILLDLERDLREPSALSIAVASDSKLVVEQVSERWKVRDADLRPLRDDALELLRRFGAWTISWHPRLESVRLLGH